VIGRGGQPSASLVEQRAWAAWEHGDLSSAGLHSSQTVGRSLSRRRAEEGSRAAGQQGGRQRRQQHQHRRPSSPVAACLHALHRRLACVPGGPSWPPAAAHTGTHAAVRDVSRQLGQARTAAMLVPRQRGTAHSAHLRPCQSNQSKRVGVGGRPLIRPQPTALLHRLIIAPGRLISTASDTLGVGPARRAACPRCAGMLAGCLPCRRPYSRGGRGVVEASEGPI
jgi:hypothetical protein